MNMTPNIPLSSAVASWLVTAGQILSGVGALILATDQMPWGIDAYDVGLSLVFASNIATVIVVALRKNVVPGVTSGQGAQ
jgi:hypothetical protein